MTLQALCNKQQNRAYNSKSDLCTPRMPRKVRLLGHQPKHIMLQARHPAGALRMRPGAPARCNNSNGAPATVRTPQPPWGRPATPA